MGINSIMGLGGLNSATILKRSMNSQMSTDATGKNIQNQIDAAQKRLQELASYENMSMEEKAQKSQEILQEITDLKNQLRQHKSEMRKEQQQAKKSQLDGMLNSSKRTAPKAKKQGAGLSQASMTALLSAGSALAQARVQSSAVTSMEGRAGVLESEIKLDASRGVNVEDKKEELAALQERMAQVGSAQMKTLTEANTKLEEAAKADQQVEKTTEEEKKTNEKKTPAEDKQDAGVTKTKEPKVVDAVSAAEAVAGPVATVETVDYPHVDVRA